MFVSKNFPRFHPFNYIGGVWQSQSHVCHDLRHSNWCLPFRLLYKNPKNAHRSLCETPHVARHVIFPPRFTLVCILLAKEHMAWLMTAISRKNNNNNKNLIPRFPPHLHLLFLFIMYAPRHTHRARSAVANVLTRRGWQLLRNCSYCASSEQLSECVKQRVCQIASSLE